jgi:hypothetical protein
MLQCVQVTDAPTAIVRPSVIVRVTTLVGMALVRPYLTPGLVRGPHRHLAPPGFHGSEGHETLRRNCVVYHRRTRCLCIGCSGVFMCSSGCYIRVHTQPRYAANFRH